MDWILKYQEDETPHTSVCDCKYKNSCMRITRNQYEKCKNAEKINGKCRGYQRSEYDDEPAEMCKECTDSMFYENE